LFQFPPFRRTTPPPHPRPAPSRPRNLIVDLSSCSPLFHPGLFSLLLVTKYGQRPLAENTVGTRKTHNQCQQHREEKTDTKHLRVHVPGKLEHIPQHGP